jgi:putative ABC transport system substrate-binding protein
MGVGAAGLGLLAGCGRLPWQAEPPERVYRIGVLTGALTQSSAWLEAFRQGLRERGWIPGHNITLEYRSAEGHPDRLPALATELVQIPVDVIMAGGPDASWSAKAATSTIPIVMGGSTDAVEIGLVPSLARPGGNLTGLSAMRGQLGAKRLELLAAVLPSGAQVALLSIDNSGFGYNPTEVESFEAASRKLGVQLQLLQVLVPEDLEGAFEAAERERTAAVVVPGSPRDELRTLIADLAAKHGMASISERREFAVAGGLMAYGPNGVDQYRRAAYFVDRVLKGAKPADIPVEQPMTFDFVVNMKTARELGIVFPEEIRLQITEVIQ